jgi:16S rRNA processing protein RimM
MQGEYIPLGYIVSPHGIKGHVLIKTFSGEGNSLLRGIFLSVKISENEYRDLKISNVQPYKGLFRVKFEEIVDRNSSEKIAGKEIFIKREYLPKLNENEFYWVDLIGCSVYSTENEYIGIVEELIETGAVDVIVVKKDLEEHLYPLTESIVKKIDVSRKKIVVDVTIFREAGL